jgi:phosphoenolpyruvate carboxylase
VYYDTIGELFTKIKKTFGNGHFHLHEDIIQLGSGREETEMEIHL